MSIEAVRKHLEKYSLDNKIKTVLCKRYHIT